MIQKYRLVVGLAPTLYSISSYNNAYMCCICLHLPLCANGECECRMLCLHIISYIVAKAVLSWDKSLELFVQSLEMDFSVSLVRPHFHCTGNIVVVAADVVVQTTIISSELKENQD